MVQTVSVRRVRHCASNWLYQRLAADGNGYPHLLSSLIKLPVLPEEIDRFLEV
jgi:hypothetical protein